MFQIVIIFCITFITDGFGLGENVKFFLDCSILDYLWVPYNFAIINDERLMPVTSDKTLFLQQSLQNLYTIITQKFNLIQMYSLRGQTKKRKVAYSWFGMTKSSKCVTRTLLHMFRWKKLNKNCHAMYMKSMIWKVCMKSPLCGQIKEFDQQNLIGNSQSTCFIY